MRKNFRGTTKTVLVGGLLAMAAVGCGGGSSATTASGGGAASGAASPAAGTHKIAAVFSGSVTASGWDRDGKAALDAMASTMGVKASTIESLAYDKASQTLDRLANQGYDIIIAHSSGFEPSVLEVAPKHPKTQFILFSDISTTTPPPNVAAWKINWNELGYLVGTAMCTISPTGNVGHVSSAPIPAFTRLAGGLAQATESEGNCKGKKDALKITFTGSFTDAALAKSAALSILGKGADVLSDGADAAGKAVVASAIEKKIPYVGGLFDVAPDGPGVVATSIPINFNSAYAEMGKLLSDGTIKQGGIYDVDVKSGGLDYTKPVKIVPNAADVTKALDSAISRIKDGSLSIDPKREIKG
ncbi:MAG: Basic rane lipoprotein [Frankiales bacterium]|nr:Basic rane lipoprotein [Frankiales bacterium]